MIQFETDTLLAKIKANSLKLEQCKKHSFDFPKGLALQFGEKLTCSNCGGTMDAVQAFRYCEGFEAAGGNPNEIIDGFR